MKRTLAIFLALLMVLALVACTKEGTQEGETPAGQSEGTQTQSTGSELAGTYDITVWAAEKVVDLTKKQIEDFNNTNEYGIKFNAIVEAVGEGDAATKMTTDVQAGGDIYFFAQDQFNRLVQAKALDKLGKNATEFVQTSNVEASITAATTGDTFYAYPVTADNTFFVFYDKGIVKEDSLDDIAKMIKDCEDNGKTFCFDLKNGWYLPAFFFGTGCKSTWEADDAGKFLSVSDNFNSDKGFIAAKAMNVVMNSEKFISSSETSEFDNNAGFVISGTWNTENAKSILGDRFGAAPLPKFTVDGKSYQLSPFTGSKLVGVKPQTDAKRGAALHRLAQYLTGEKAQIERFEAAGWGPSNVNALKSEKVLADAVLGAIAQQAPYSVYQGNIPGNWWGNSAQVLGEALQQAKDDNEIKAALAAYEESLGDYLKKEGEEEVPDFWGVIGSFEASGWNTDMVMTEKEPGIWVSDPIEMKAGDQFKVRKNGDWSENYGIEADGSTTAGGTTNNVNVPADDVYTVTLDLNTITLSFVNQEGILPEAAPVEPVEGEEPVAEEPDTWGVIGLIDWDNDIPMFEKEGIFKAVVVLKAGNQFKVRANGKWDKNFGFEEENLFEGTATPGGQNIVVPEGADGTYLVTLDPNEEAPSLIIEKMTVWGVVGSYAGSNWGNDGADVAMTEQEIGVWVSDPVELKAGDQFKVRADGKWDINFGPKDDTIMQDGDNVTVEADGNYIVKLDLNAMTLTLEPAA